MGKNAITKMQDTGTKLANKIAIKLDKALTETYFKVYVCNNGNDTNPTWEDCTSSVNNGYYSFVNTTKTSNNGAIMVKMVMEYSSDLNINTLTIGNFTFDATYLTIDDDGMSMIKSVVLKDFSIETTKKLWYEYTVNTSNLGGYESITDEVVSV